MTTLDGIRNDCMGRYAPGYAAKQLHPVPEASVVNRESFILERCRGRSVLDVGASGPMHNAIMDVAGEYIGVDRISSRNVFAVNLDSPNALLPDRKIDLVVCGEVIEHLSNPGQFLVLLRETYPGVPVLITVPNAFSEIARRRMEEGIEAVNSDHVSWYSWHTLKVLLGRAGYRIREMHWYNGRPRFAEGLIAVTE